MRKTTLLAAAVAALVLTPAAAHAACTAKNLTGTWSLAFSGTINNATHGNVCRLKGSNGELERVDLRGRRTDDPCASDQDPTPGTIEFGDIVLAVSKDCRVTAEVWEMSAAGVSFACTADMQMLESKDQIGPGVIWCTSTTGTSVTVREWPGSLVRVGKARKK